ncbi:MAG TPA: RNA polymerase sigma factor [Pirellulales bacterium]
MESSPTTRYSLLARLVQPSDEQAWREFMEIYEPLIYRQARRRGFQDADAADLCQEVFQATSKAIERWQARPDRGAFRPWLFQIARNVMINTLRARQRQFNATGASDARRLLEEQPAEDEESRLLDLQYERQLFHWAAEQVRAEFREATWRAFWLTGVEGQKPQQAAEELQMSVGAVYIARSRVMARLREKIEAVEGSNRAE